MWSLTIMKSLSMPSSCLLQLHVVDCRTIHRELEEMEPILNFQVPAESLELVILLDTQY